MLSLEYILLIGSTLILISIVIAKVTDNLGFPTLLLFLGIGMFAGSEGPGGIYFDDAALAQSIGVIALVFILFAGGLDTNWNSVRPVVKHAISLATFGVLFTAIAVGIFTHYVLQLPLFVSFLLGAIISSTDAAAVFSILRSKNVSLKGNLKPLLELESGSNDPMAVFLTIGILQILTSKIDSFTSLIVLFIFQMGIGAAFGFGFGKAIVFALNRLRVAYEGLYPVFSLAFAGFIYAATASIGGSGFLAVYIAGIILGNSDFIQKRSLVRFFDGLAWLSQITMFLTLGLLVFPSHIVPVIGAGFAVSFFLMFVARPLSVFLGLSVSKLVWKEKLFIAWVGLRGSVPIVLATFPLLAHIQFADTIFNIVFFIVLSSALLQGWTIPVVARWLGVDAPVETKRAPQFSFQHPESVDAEIVDFIVPYNAEIAGKQIVELGLPHDSLVVMINRDSNYVVPSGGTILQEGDTALILVNKTNLPLVRKIFSQQKTDRFPTTFK